MWRLMPEWLVVINDGFWFVVCSIWQGIPLNRWSCNWEKLQEMKLAEIHKIVWELKKQGKIREDKDGFLYKK